MSDHLSEIFTKLQVLKVEVSDLRKQRDVLLEACEAALKASTFRGGCKCGSCCAYHKVEAAIALAKEEPR